jgi:hypothetical protein
MSRFDILKICGYIVGFGTLASVNTIAAILQPFGASPALVSQVIGWIGALTILASLIANTLKNPSPPAGFSSTVAPTGSTPPLTAAEITTNPQINANVAPPKGP